jgi:hypothetical protein
LRLGFDLGGRSRGGICTLVESVLQPRWSAARIALWVRAPVWLAALGCALAEPVELPPLPSLADPAAVSYREQVQPVLERRCVVCHGCYDAPCQLRLSSQEGILRGASKGVVYDSARLVAMEPTRLFLDAHGERQWRARGFFSVLGGPVDSRVRSRRSSTTTRWSIPRVGCPTEWPP